MATYFVSFLDLLGNLGQGHSGLCKLWIFKFYTFLILKVSDSEYGEATVDFLLNHVRWQTRKLYGLVCTDFCEIVVLKFIIKKNQMKCQVQTNG
jgi:hypothetical protein